MITDFKGPSKENSQSLDFNAPILETVEKEVENYIESRNIELDELKSLEKYRKEYPPWFRCAHP